LRTLSLAPADVARALPAPAILRQLEEENMRLRASMSAAAPPEKAGAP
jgi:hypothetical protein